MPRACVHEHAHCAASAFISLQRGLICASCLATPYWCIGDAWLRVLELVVLYGCSACISQGAYRTWRFGRRRASGK